MSTIFFDLDGVLANFDKGAEQVIGTNNIYRYEFVHGPEGFWEALNSRHDFFESLEVMPGAERMLQAVRHHHIKILTALPKVGAEAVDRQKRLWVEKNLSCRCEVITCQTQDKPNYCSFGDVLIDDRAVNKDRWEAAGGRFILHLDVQTTIEQLKSMLLTRG